MGRLDGRADRVLPRATSTTELVLPAESPPYPVAGRRGLPEHLSRGLRRAGAAAARPRATASRRCCGSTASSAGWPPRPSAPRSCSASWPAPRARSRPSSTNLAYPLGDLIMLAFVIVVMTVTGRRGGSTWAAARAGLRRLGRRRLALPLPGRVGHLRGVHAARHGLAGGLRADRRSPPGGPCSASTRAGCAASMLALPALMTTRGARAARRRPLPAPQRGRGVARAARRSRPPSCASRSSSARTCSCSASARSRPRPTR